MDKATFLIKQAFKQLNEYKRFRALHETEATRGNTAKAKEYELDKFKRIDALELLLRGLQSEIRKDENQMEESSNE